MVFHVLPLKAEGQAIKVLVACEYSGRVRDAFLAKGHDAWSCDVDPTITADKTRHIQADVMSLLGEAWDLMIAFPPCTHITTAGQYWRGTPEEAEALEFVRTLMGADIPRICIENPRGKINTVIRQPDQRVQPWHFGDPWIKLTCLWLKGLPLLTRQNETPPIYGSWVSAGSNGAAGGARGMKLRSLTFRGLANAMADQWG